ncbi:MAG: hypothetical protein P8Y99_17935 [Calditrichaceae bacterium]
MQSNHIYKSLFIITIFLIVITKPIYGGDNQSSSTLFSHIQVGLNSGLTPFDSKHDTPMHYQFDMGYRFQDNSAVLMSLYFYQLWNEGEEGENYRTLPGKYNEFNVAIIYRVYLDKIIPVDYLDRFSIGSGIGVNNDSRSSISLSFTPSYDIKLSKSITLPVGVIFIYNPNSVNENVYSNNYWGIFLGIRYN